MKTEKLTIGILVIFILILAGAVGSSFRESYDQSSLSLDQVPEEGYQFKGKILGLSEDVMLTEYVVDEEVDDRVVFTYDKTKFSRIVQAGDEIMVYTNQNPMHSKQVLAERIEVE